MITISLQGIEAPALGFGTFRIDGEDATRAVRLALDVGYRHVDTAEMYGNEAEVGAGIAASSVPREDIFLTTKVWHTNLRPDDVRKAATESLAKLKTDYVDLLLVHWPDPTAPLNETLAAFQELQAAGKARLIGVSNFPVALMREAVETHKAPIACNQVEYHPFLNQAPVLDYARSKSMMVTAYCPIARGAVADSELMQAIGRHYNKSAVQIGLRWLVQQDRVAAIPKSATEKNIRANFDIFDFELSAEDMARITALGGNGRLVKPAFGPSWDPSPAVA